jgi:hypothetical protein
MNQDCFRVKKLKVFKPCHGVIFERKGNEVMADGTLTYLMKPGRLYCAYCGNMFGESTRELIFPFATYQLGSVLLTDLDTRRSARHSYAFRCPSCKRRFFTFRSFSIEFVSLEAYMEESKEFIQQKNNTKMEKFQIWTAGIQGPQYRGEQRAGNFIEAVAIAFPNDIDKDSETGAVIMVGDYCSVGGRTVYPTEELVREAMAMGQKSEIVRGEVPPPPPPIATPTAATDNTPPVVNKTPTDSSLENQPQTPNPNPSEETTSGTPDASPSISTAETEADKGLDQDHSPNQTI